MAEAVRSSIIQSDDYAGFWRRFASACIDLALYAPIYLGLRYGFDIALGHAPGVSAADANIDFAGTAARPSEIYRWWFEGLFGLIAIATYCAFFASPMQGSPGMYPAQATCDRH